MHGGGDAAGQGVPVVRPYVPAYRYTLVVLISQRISAVRNADRILVLQQGRIAGLGTHEELAASCEAYRELCRSFCV